MSIASTANDVVVQFRIDAPAFPQEKTRLENATILFVLLEALDANSCLVEDEDEALTDRIFAEVYGDMRIPPRQRRRNGWTPWLEAWNRIRLKVMEIMSTLQRSGT